MVLLSRHWSREIAEDTNSTKDDYGHVSQTLGVVVPWQQSSFMGRCSQADDAKNLDKRFAHLSP